MQTTADIARAIRADVKAAQQRGELAARLTIAVRCHVARSSDSITAFVTGMGSTHEIRTDPTNGWPTLHTTDAARALGRQITGLMEAHRGDRAARLFLVVSITEDRDTFRAVAADLLARQNQWAAANR